MSKRPDNAFALAGLFGETADKSKNPFLRNFLTSHTLPAALPTVCPLPAGTLRSALRFQA